MNRPPVLGVVQLILTAAAIAFTLVEVPLSVVFQTKLTGVILVAELIASVIQLADLKPRIQHILRSAATDGSSWRRFGFKAALRLIFDILASLPIGVVLPGHWRLLRLVLLTRLMQLVRELVKVGGRLTRFTPASLRLVSFGFWTVLSAHGFACAWMALGGCDDTPEPALRYLRSIYWTVTTLGTVGYGDITPKTAPQMIFAIFVMILGTGIFGYVIGSFASLIANLDLAKAHHNERVDQVSAYLEYRRIESPLRERVLSYYDYLWESRMGFDERNVLNELPPSLRTELALSINRALIEKVPLFKEAGEEFIREIVVALRPLVFPPGDMIVRRGEVGDEMFFINRGVVEIVGDDFETVYATLTEGQFFGEIALLTKAPRNATARAAAYCDLYVLDRATFEHVLGRYPKVAEKIQVLARKRLTEKLDFENRRKTDSFDRGRSLIEDGLLAGLMTPPSGVSPALQRKSKDQPPEEGDAPTPESTRPMNAEDEPPPPNDPS